MNDSGGTAPASAFALERLREIDTEHLVYESTKPDPGGKVSLLLTPMRLLDETTTVEPLHRRAARYVWALLLARVYYEELPLVCPQCGGKMKIVAFIMPTLWEMQGTEPGESDPQAQPAPDYDFD